MKRTVFFCFALLSFLACRSQTEIGDFLGTPNRAVIARGSLYAERALYLPHRDTNFTAFRAGLLVLRPADSLIYRSTGRTLSTEKKWELIGSGIGGGPAGSDYLVQFKLGTGFGADNALTYNDVANRLHADTMAALSGRFGLIDIPRGNTRMIRFHNLNADTPTIGTRPYGEFAFTQSESLINADGQRDVVNEWGYNFDGVGGRRNANEAAFGWRFENHYIPFPGAQPQAEIILYSVAKNGAVNRHIGFDIRKSDGVTAAYMRAESFQFFPSNSVSAYASIGNGGLDILTNSGTGFGSALRLYDGDAGITTLSNGGGSALLQNQAGMFDFTLQTPRTIYLSNQIRFNDYSTSNSQNVTFDLSTTNANKSFFFRDAAQNPLMQIQDSLGAGMHMTTIYGVLKLPGYGAGYLQVEADGRVSIGPGGGGGGGSGDVTSIETSSTNGQLVQMSGTSGKNIKKYTENGFVVVSGGVPTAQASIGLGGSDVSGTLPISKGGTGATAQSSAINALLPTQTGNAGRFLTTNGTDPSWAVVSFVGGSGTIGKLPIWNTTTGLSNSIFSDNGGEGFVDGLFSSRTGSGGFGVFNRTTNTLAYAFYSATGNWDIYSYVGGSNILSLSPTGQLTLQGYNNAAKKNLSIQNGIVSADVIDPATYLENPLVADTLLYKKNDSTWGIKAPIDGAGYTVTSTDSTFQILLSGNFVSPTEYGVNIYDSVTNQNIGMQQWWANWGYKPLYLPPNSVINIGPNRLVLPRKNGTLFGFASTHAKIKSAFIDSTGSGADTVNQINGMIYGDTAWTGTTIRGVTFENYGASNRGFINQAIMVAYMGTLATANPSYNFIVERVNLDDVAFTAPNASLHALKFYAKRSGNPGGTVRYINITRPRTYNMGASGFDFAGGGNTANTDDKWLHNISITDYVGDGFGSKNTYGFGITSETSHSNHYARWRLKGYKNIGMEMIKNSFTTVKDVVLEGAQSSTLAVAWNGDATHLREGNVMEGVTVKDTGSLGIQVQYQDNMKLRGNTFVFGGVGGLILFNGVQNISIQGDNYDNRTAAGGTTVIFQGASKNNNLTDVVIRSDSANGGTGVFSTNLVFSGSGTSGNKCDGCIFRAGSGGITAVTETASASGNSVINYSINGIRANYSKTFSETARLMDMGGHKLWFNGNMLMFKNGTPSSATDGSPVVVLDATPTNGSANGITSDAVFDALANKQTLDAELNIVSALGTANQQIRVKSDGTGLEYFTPSASGTDVTMSAAIGSSPNAAGASINGAGQVLTLQPADGSNPGVITAGTQSIGGVKTFTGDRIVVNKIAGAGSAPAASTNSPLGTPGQNASVTGNDLSGEITLTTGSGSLSGGSLSNIIYNVSYTSVPKAVLLFPSNSAAAAQAANVYATTGGSTNNFQVNAVAALPASTVFKWHYVVIQ